LRGERPPAPEDVPPFSDVDTALREPYRPGEEDQRGEKAEPGPERVRRRHGDQAEAECECAKAEARRHHPLSYESHRYQLPSLDGVEGEEGGARERFEYHADAEKEHDDSAVGPEIKREAGNPGEQGEGHGQPELERQEVGKEPVKRAPVTSDLEEHQVLQTDADRQGRDLTEGEGEYE
jgi:hypothetical protein